LNEWLSYSESTVQSQTALKKSVGRRKRDGAISFLILVLKEGYKSDFEDKLQTYNKINGAIRRYFGKK
jgi:hypothetical protein